MNQRRRNEVAVALVALSVVVFGAPGVAQGQTETNRRVWTAVSLQGRLGVNSPWHWTLDSNARARDGAGTLDLLAGRVTVTRDVTRRTRVGISYAYGEGFPDARSLREHRLTQQYTWSAGVSARVSLRSRLEERFVTGSEAVRLRFRQQVRLTWPLASGGPLRGVVSEEVLVTANAAAGASRGVDSNRIFVGIDRALTPRSEVEVGYLNLRSRGGASDRRTSHVVSATLVVSL